MTPLTPFGTRAPLEPWAMSHSMRAPSAAQCRVKPHTANSTEPSAANPTSHVCHPPGALGLVQRSACFFPGVGGNAERGVWDAVGTLGRRPRCRGGTGMGGFGGAPEFAGARARAGADRKSMWAPDGCAVSSSRARLPPACASPACPHRAPLPPMHRRCTPQCTACDLRRNAMTAVHRVVCVGEIGRGAGH